MNVIMLTGDNSILKGQAGPFLETLKGLSAHWGKITVLCPYTPGPYDPCPLPNNVTLIPLGPVKLLTPWSVFTKIKSLMAHHEYDLIVSHDYGLMLNGIGAFWASQKFKRPFVSEIHHVEGHPLAANLKERFYRFWARCYLSFIARHALFIRVVNPNEIMNFLEKCQVSPKKIKVIPSLYIDKNLFSPSSPEKKYDLIYCGRLASNKGIQQILLAVSQVKKNFPQIKFLIKGTGPLEKEIKEQAQSLGLEHNTIFKPWVQDQKELAELYNQSKMLVCASLAEGGPRVTVEAMACGVPVISTPVGIMSSLIEHGQNGLLYSWDTEKLAQLIEDLLGDTSRREEMGAQARESVQSFEKNKALEFYANSYKDFLRNGVLNPKLDDPKFVN